MTVSRILFGLDRLPNSLASDDPRLPGVDVGSTPLRLNSVPLPTAAWGDGGADHAARMDGMRAWLLASCGDYNGGIRRAVGQYLDDVSAHIATNREALAAGLARFHGLYQPEDWCWSALRPLPRAWWLLDGTWQRADVAFWDGSAVVAIGANDTIPLGHFWAAEILPVSPFRRPPLQTVISNT